jgi:hypothetical protein
MPCTGLALAPRLVLRLFHWHCWCCKTLFFLIRSRSMSSPLVILQNSLSLSLWVATSLSFLSNRVASSFKQPWVALQLILGRSKSRIVFSSSWLPLRMFGFHIYKLCSFSCDQYQIFFNLWRNGGAQWEFELEKHA